MLKRTSRFIACGIKLAQSLRFRLIKNLSLLMIKHAFLFVPASLIKLAQNMLKAAIFFGEPLWTCFFELTKFLFFVHLLLLYSLNQE